jgi:hypothetical protein
VRRSPRELVDTLIVGRDLQLAELRAVIDRVPGAPRNVVPARRSGRRQDYLAAGWHLPSPRGGLRVIGGTGYETEALLAFAGLS